MLPLPAVVAVGARLAEAPVVALLVVLLAVVGVRTWLLASSPGPGDTSSIGSSVPRLTSPLRGEGAMDDEPLVITPPEPCVGGA